MGLGISGNEETLVRGRRGLDGGVGGSVHESMERRLLAMSSPEQSPEKDQVQLYFLPKLTSPF